jgi:hypothetical protein
MYKPKKPARDQSDSNTADISVMSESIEETPAELSEDTALPEAIDVSSVADDTFDEEMPDIISTSHPESEENASEVMLAPEGELDDTLTEEDTFEAMPAEIASEHVEAEPRDEFPEIPRYSIELPENYTGQLFFYLDGGAGELYTVYSHPYHLIRAFWKEETTTDYENSLQDAVTWLYHQINEHPHLPESNACLDRVLNDTASLDDLSLTYLAELALVLPGTLVGYADNADQLNAILSPVIEGCPFVPEEMFQYSNSYEAEYRTVRVKE